ncbi:hypothetical protein K449DRAFT_427763 [Hypoxylon sp. EC38]|nr:hypothetical protein K449DRAFT_427763 [Hypoxylon sp. EC38]
MAGIFAEGYATPAQTLKSPTLLDSVPYQAQTILAKSIIKNSYGRPPKYSYLTVAFQSPPALNPPRNIPLHTNGFAASAPEIH